MIVDKLKQIGLSEKEAKLYMAALPLGVVSVAKLAKEANLNRTTAYQILEGLTKKGLFVWQITKSGKKVRANPPKKLFYFLDSQKDKIEENKKIISQLLPSLASQFAPGDLETKVLYFEGKEGVRKMIWNTLSAKKEMASYTIFERNRLLGRQWADKYRKQALKRNIKERIIIPDSQDFKKYSRQTSVPEYWQRLIRVRKIPAKKFRQFTNGYYPGQ